MTSQTPEGIPNIEEERERTLAKWKELYGNAKYSPSMVIVEFNRFVNEVISNKTNGL